MAPVIAVALAYLGGLNAYLASVAGTCTGNDAGNLFGIVLSVPIYALVLALFTWGMSQRAARVSAVLILPLLIWQAWFALNLSVRILAFGATACDVLWGAPYGADGNELRYAGLWLGTGLGLPLMLALILGPDRPASGADTGGARHSD